MLKVFRLGLALMQCNKLAMDILHGILPKNVLMYKKNINIYLKIQDNEWVIDKITDFPVYTDKKSSISDGLPSVYYYYSATYIYNGSSLQHKGAIFVSNNELSFYEPYGLYSKYELDYGSVLLDYANKLGYKSKLLKYKTQDHIITTNNALKTEFDAQMRNLGYNTKEDSRFEIVEGKKYAERKDNTYYMFDYLKKLGNSKMDDDEVDKLIKIFGLYNSKICVSITLVETWHYYHNSLPEFHNAIRKARYPSWFIFRELKQILDKTELVKKYSELDLNSSNSDICYSFAS